MVLRKQYHRLNPVVDKRLEAYNLKQVEEALAQVLGSQGTMDQLERTLHWISRSGWLEDAAASAQPKPKAKAS
jgi:hypothetical protein